MPVRCCVCGASNQTASLFEFPKKEPYRTQWKEFAGIAEIKSSKLCHRHFIEEVMYPIEQRNVKDENDEKRKYRRRPKPDAVPSIKFYEGLCDIKDVKLPKKYYCLQCKTTDSVIHFRFPENLEKKNEWLKRCGYGPDFFNGDKFWYLCVRHFSDNFILKKKTSKGYMRLRADALPTMFMAKQPWSSDSTSLVKDTSSNKPVIDYSLFPRKILPAVNTSAVSDIKKACHSSIADMDVDRIDQLDNAAPNELRSSEPPPSVELQTACDATSDDKIITPSSTYCINSIRDYTSPTVVSKILTLSSHKDCVECVAFKRHVVTSLKDVSSSPEVTPVPHGKAIKRSLRYPGDISTPDYAIPKRARHMVHLLKGEVNKHRKKVHVLQKQNKYWRDRIKKYHDLISHLKEKNFLLESAYTDLN